MNLISLLTGGLRAESSDQIEAAGKPAETGFRNVLVQVLARLGLDAPREPITKIPTDANPGELVDGNGKATEDPSVKVNRAVNPGFENADSSLNPSRPGLRSFATTGGSDVGRPVETTVPEKASPILIESSSSAIVAEPKMVPTGRIGNQVEEIAEWDQPLPVRADNRRTSPQIVLDSASVNQPGVRTEPDRSESLPVGRDTVPRMLPDPIAGEVARRVSDPPMTNHKPGSIPVTPVPGTESEREIRSNRDRVGESPAVRSSSRAVRTTTDRLIPDSPEAQGRVPSAAPGADQLGVTDDEAPEIASKPTIASPTAASLATPAPTSTYSSLLESSGPDVLPIADSRVPLPVSTVMRTSEGASANAPNVLVETPQETGNADRSLNSTDAALSTGTLQSPPTSSMVLESPVTGGSPVRNRTPQRPQEQPERQYGDKNLVNADLGTGEKAPRTAGASDRPTGSPAGNQPRLGVAHLDPEVVALAGRAVIEPTRVKPTGEKTATVRPAPGDPSPAEVPRQQLQAQVPENGGVRLAEHPPVGTAPQSSMKLPVASGSTTRDSERLEQRAEDVVVDQRAPERSGVNNFAPGSGGSVRTSPVVMRSHLPMVADAAAVTPGISQPDAPRTANVSITNADGQTARVQVTVTGDQVVTRIVHSDPEAAKAFASRGDELRSALSRQGFESSHLVSSSSSPWASGRTPEEPGQADQSTRQRDGEEDRQRDERRDSDRRRARDERSHEQPRGQNRRRDERWLTE